MENSNEIYAQANKELNLFNDFEHSDFDDEENDETYEITANDLKCLRSDEKEDSAATQTKKVLFRNY